MVQSQKALDTVTYLHEEEAEFCDIMRRSYRYHDMQMREKLNEADTLALFQNMDMVRTVCFVSHYS